MDEEKLLAWILLPSSCLWGCFYTMYMEPTMFTSVFQFVQRNSFISLLVSSVLT